MKVKSFAVGPYRNILDTGEISADPNVTVLVGKNESGKTNLLHALHALSPANGSRGFPRLDYPRWLQKSHERSGEFQRAQPVRASFALEPGDMDAVQAQFGAGVLLTGDFSVVREYDSDTFKHYIPACDVQIAIANALSGVAVSSAPDIGQLRQRLAEDAKQTDDEGNATPLAAASMEALRKVDATFGKADTVAGAVGAFLRSRLPHFFYFDDFAQLPGTTNIEPLVAALQEGTTPTSPMRTEPHSPFSEWDTPMTNSSPRTMRPARPNCRPSVPS